MKNNDVLHVIVFGIVALAGTVLVALGKLPALPVLAALLGWSAPSSGAAVARLLSGGGSDDGGTSTPVVPMVPPSNKRISVAPPVQRRLALGCLALWLLTFSAMVVACDAFSSSPPPQSPSAAQWQWDVATTACIAREAPRGTVHAIETCHVPDKAWLGAGAIVWLMSVLPPDEQTRVVTVLEAAVPVVATVLLVDGGGR